MPLWRTPVPILSPSEEQRARMKLKSSGFTLLRPVAECHSDYKASDQSVVFLPFNERQKLVSEIVAIVPLQSP